jgi:hypothetical protein
MKPEETAVAKQGLGKHVPVTKNTLAATEELTELLGFWTFFIVLYSREHDVSETGSVSVLR